jgi:D-alanine-D-alanine ligase
MSEKIRVAILFGGKSAEHEVSLQSAKNVIESIDKKKYDVVLIGIDKNGQWYLNDESHFLLHADNPKLIKLNKALQTVALVPGEKTHQLIGLSNKQSAGQIDVVFPILHGPFGEDGTIQGLLKLANIPFVGAGVLGSAVGMDKDTTKRLLRDADIPIAKFLVFTSQSFEKVSYDDIAQQLGVPFFIKPANLGSSVGISKVKSFEEFDNAVKNAFLFDTKIILEETVSGREIECAVLGNEDPIASLPGEILPQHEFYSYEAKYIDENGALLEIPAQLEKSKVKEIQSLAVRTFKVLCCEGMARVDFFLKESGEVLVNELNTIPGFTRISMYPKLWEMSGIPYSELIDRLIQLALERFEKEKKLKTSL